MKNEFYHNNEKVIYQMISEDRFINVLYRKSVEPIELPDPDMSYTVYRYSVNGVKRYACAIRTADGQSERVFITDSIPEDGWNKLMTDVYAQYNGAEPTKMETRKEVAYKLANKNAHAYIQEKYPNDAATWMVCGYPDKIQNEIDDVVKNYMAGYGYFE